MINATWFTFASKYSDFLQNLEFFLQVKTMNQKEKPKKKKDLRKSFEEWNEKPTTKKKLQEKPKVKHPKSWIQEEEL